MGREKEQLRKCLDKNAIYLQMKSKRQSKRGQQRATQGRSGHPQRVREFDLKSVNNGKLLKVF